MSDRDEVDYPAVLRQRLRAIAGILGATAELEAEIVDAPLRDVLVSIAGLARARGGSAPTWLLFVAVTGCFPIPDEVEDLRRRLELSRTDIEAAALTMRGTRTAASQRGVWDKPMRLVTDAMVIDVSFCAQYEHNTGIQRLVREAMSRWHAAGRAIEFVAWDHDVIPRSLFPEEIERVVNWADPERSRNEYEHTGTAELIVPVNTTFFVPEVPREPLCAPLEGLAEHSDNRVCAIGYDAIPLVSADLVKQVESERFSRYLSFIKYTDRVVGISAAAAGEFRGFASAVRAQNLKGPAVVEVSLPVDLPDATSRQGSETELPLVLSVGSHEPRKNQEGILHAAELLWADGVEFQLTFVGRGDAGWTVPFDRRLAKLRKAGHHVESRRTASDQEVSHLYHSALVTVFPSLHEGYGLPVAESLAAGTPVITTNYGSTAEIGAAGGCLLVDPRDDASLLAAMRTVLTEPDAVAKLEKQIASRSRRSWDDYALELWNALEDVSIA